MRPYRNLQRFIAGFLLFLFFGGLLTLATPRQEIYPVYSWFLFALTPNTTVRYALQVTEYRNQPLEKPLLYQDADGFVPHPHAVTVVKIAKEWGAAVQTGDAGGETNLRRLFESNFLSGPTRYDLVRITYDPIPRWKTGDVRTEIVRRYVFPAPSP